MKRLESIRLRDIEITDRFWRKYTDLIPEVVLPYQWEMLNDRVACANPSHCLRNYRIAAGEEKGSHSGVVFVDTDLTKWLEAVSYTLETRPDPELEQRADEVIGLIGRVQQSDGYINTYYTIAQPQGRWSNLTEGHELYSAGHLIEAAVAYYKATGKDSLLRTAARFADLLCRTFGNGEGQIHGYPGHPEIELALVKLYYVTHEEKYLDLARYFVEERGGTPNYFMEEMKRDGFTHFFDEFKDYEPAYSQSHIHPRRQRTAEGHAVRAVYLCSAMAELAHEYGDTELMDACDAIWDSITTKRMYLTGSIGSSAHFERFTTDYDLPNDMNYSETCACIGLAMFSVRMARIKRDARYFDVVERALFNTVLAGIALTGNTYFYVNPLEVWPASCMDHTSKAHVKPVRQQWFNVACCPTNIARTLASLGSYLYSADDDSLDINLFVASKFTVKLNGTAVAAELNTTHMNDGKSTLAITMQQPVDFALRIRIPQYARDWAIRVNGTDQPTGEPVKGYAIINRRWSGTTVVDIEFGIQAQFVCAHPEVRADAGKVAIMKGPFVYCLEEIDNGSNLASLIVDPHAKLTEQYEPDLFGGTTVIRLMGKRIASNGWGSELYKPAEFATEPVELKAIPYCYWGNRGQNEMMVWIRADLSGCD